MSLQAARAEGPSRVQAREVNSAAPPPSGSNHDLLATPSQDPSAVSVDSLTALFGLMAEQRDQGLVTEKTQIQGDRHLRDAELRKRFEAMEKEAKARSGRGFFGSLGKIAGDIVKNVGKGRIDRVFTETAKNLEDTVNSPKFWSDLAKGAATVAKVAAAAVAVATLVTGPGAVGGVAFAAAIISAVAMLESEIKVMDRLGVDTKTAGNIRLGVAAGTAAVGGAGMLLNNATSAGTTAAAQAADKGAQAAQTTSTMAQVKQTTTAVQAGARVYDAGAKTVEAGSQIAIAERNRVAENHRADGEHHGHQKEFFDNSFERRVQTSVEQMESFEKITDLIVQTLAARDQSTLSLAAAIGGRA